MVRAGAWLSQSGLPGVFSRARGLYQPLRGFAREAIDAESDGGQAQADGQPGVRTAVHEEPTIEGKGAYDHHQNAANLIHTGWLSRSLHPNGRTGGLTCAARNPIVVG